MFQRQDGINNIRVELPPRETVNPDLMGYTDPEVNNKRYKKKKPYWYLRI